MKEYVLDANALVRFFRRTPGSSTVAGLIENARAGRAKLSISVINLGEVFYVLAKYFGEEEARRYIKMSRPAIEFVPVDEETALESASLRFRYKLGTADSCAAQLAMRMGASLVTADPEFARLGKRLKILALPRHSA